MQGTVAQIEPKFFKDYIPEIKPRPSPDLHKTHLLKIVTGMNILRPLRFFTTVCGSISIKVTDKISECNCDDCLRIIKDIAEKDNEMLLS